MENIEGAQILYRIRVDTPYGRYSDSLYFSLDAWGKLTQEELDAAIKTRVDGWIKAITTPVEPYVPTEADLISEKERIAGQLQEAEARLTEYFPPKPIAELNEEEVMAAKMAAEETLRMAQAKVEMFDMALSSISMAKAAVEPIEVVVKG